MNQTLKDKQREDATLRKQIAENQDYIKRKLERIVLFCSVAKRYGFPEDATLAIKQLRKMVRIKPELPEWEGTKTEFFKLFDKIWHKSYLLPKDISNQVNTVQLHVARWANANDVRTWISRGRGGTDYA